MDNTLKLILLQYKQGRSFEDTKQSLLDLFGVRLSLPTNEDIAIQIVASFLHNPHPNQRKNYDREKKAFAEGAKWMREEIEKRNKGNEA